MKLSKKHFGRIAILPFKKFIGRSAKEFKEVFGQKHPKKLSRQETPNSVLEGVYVLNQNFDT